MRTISLRRDTRGHVHILLSLVVIAAVAGITVLAFKLHHNKVATTTPTTSPSSTTIPSAIKSKADVTQAAAALKSDQTASQLDPSQLNDDLNSLL